MNQRLYCTTNDCAWLSFIYIMPGAAWQLSAFMLLSPLQLKTLHLSILLFRFAQANCITGTVVATDRWLIYLPINTNTNWFWALAIDTICIQWPAGDTWRSDKLEFLVCAKRGETIWCPPTDEHEKPKHENMMCLPIFYCIYILY